MNIRDIATWTLWELGRPGPVNINAVGFPWWLAGQREMQLRTESFQENAWSPLQDSPPTGEILDMFLIVSQEFIISGFPQPGDGAEFPGGPPDEPTPELVEAWNGPWEPVGYLATYMHARSLPHRLGRLQNCPP